MVTGVLGKNGCRTSLRTRRLHDRRPHTTSLHRRRPLRASLVRSRKNHRGRSVSLHGGSWRVRLRRGESGSSSLSESQEEVPE